MAVTPLLIAALVSRAVACADTLTDDAIVAYAAKPKGEIPMEATSEILGVHHGVKVIVDFACTGICPADTPRVIHYDVKPGPACEKAGGLSRQYLDPRGSYVRFNDFCVPKILVDKNL